MKTNINNKKILTFAIAMLFVLPLTTHADYESYGSGDFYSYDSSGYDSGDYYSYDTGYSSGDYYSYEPTYSSGDYNSYNTGYDSGDYYSYDTGYGSGDYYSYEPTYSSGDYNSYDIGYGSGDYNSYDIGYGSGDYYSYDIGYGSGDFYSYEPTYSSGDYNSYETGYSSGDFYSYEPTYSSGDFNSYSIVDYPASNEVYYEEPWYPSYTTYGDDYYGGGYNNNGGSGCSSSNCNGGGSNYNGYNDYNDYNNYNYNYYNNYGCTSSNCGGGNTIKTFDAICRVSDTSIEKGDRVTFTAEVYGGERPYDYKWSGDANEDTKSFTKRFTRTGRYIINLKVTDDEGRVARDTCEVQVGNSYNNNDRDINIIGRVSSGGGSASIGSVYLNQVPYTGPEDVAKGIAFVALLLAWSIAGAMIVRKKMIKNNTAKRIADFKESNKLAKI